MPSELPKIAQLGEYSTFLNLLREGNLINTDNMGKVSVMKGPSSLMIKPGPKREKLTVTQRLAELNAGIKFTDETKSRVNNNKSINPISVDSDIVTAENKASTNQKGLMSDPRSTAGTNTGDMVLSKGERLEIMKKEAALRNLDVDLVVKVFSGEGLNQNSFQSTIPTKGKGSLDGYEASFGDTQLYMLGLGKDYEEETGRKLIEENTPEGLLRITQWSLDEVVKVGWGPWSAARKLKIKPRQGLDNAQTVNNWKEDRE